MEAKEFFQNYKEELEGIAARYEQRQAAMLPVLNLAQEKCGHVSPEVEEGVAEFLGVPVVHVHEVVTFYTLLRRKPVGKYHFQVCDTISCSLLGCEGVLAKLSERLGIKPGETSPDGRYTLSKVECLGACEKAPMMQLNEEYVGPLAPHTIEEILKELA